MLSIFVVPCPSRCWVGALVPGSSSPSLAWLVLVVVVNGLIYHLESLLVRKKMNEKRKNLLVFSVVVPPSSLSLSSRRCRCWGLPRPYPRSSPLFCPLGLFFVVVPLSSLLLSPCCRSHWGLPRPYLRPSPSFLSFSPGLSSLIFHRCCSWS